MARLARRLAEDVLREDVAAASRVLAELWLRRSNGDEPSNAEWTATWQQAHAAWQQTDAAWQQAHATWQQWYTWLADVVCDELGKK